MKVMSVCGRPLLPSTGRSLSHVLLSSEAGLRIELVEDAVCPLINCLVAALTESGLAHCLRRVGLDHRRVTCGGY